MVMESYRLEGITSLATLKHSRFGLYYNSRHRKYIIAPMLHTSHILHDFKQQSMCISLQAWLSIYMVTSCLENRKKNKLQKR